MSKKQINRQAEKALRALEERVRLLQKANDAKTLQEFLITIRRDSFWNRLKFCWRIIRKK